MAVTIYDVAIDESRAVTQADVDMLVAVRQAYGKLREFAAQTHAELLAEGEKVRERERLAASAVAGDGERGEVV